MVKAYLAEIGRRGGQKSKRKLTKAQARAMVRARTAKRPCANPNLQPAMNPNVRCKVACEWLDGGVTLRYSESRDWSSEEDALSYAAGCHRSGKYSSIRVRYSRKRMGRWQNAGSVAYPPNEGHQRP